MSVYRVSSNKSSQNQYPSVRPTLDLDFANTKTLDPRITFTRASGGSYYGADGLIKLAGVNEARFDHDPVTGESLGLLVEEARTNTFQYSSNFSNAYWSTYRSVIANPNGGLAPDGTLTANYVGSAGVLGGRNRHIGGAAPGFVSISVFVKSETATSASIYCDLDGAAASCSASYTFATNTATASIGGANSPSNFRNLSAQGISLPNGWTRFVFVFDKYAGSGIGVNIQFGLSGGSGWMWGACQEAGSFPTSYIPTEASTRTRAADNASITGTNFSSWYRQDEGTALVDYISRGRGSSNVAYPIALWNGGFGQSFGMAITGFGASAVTPYAYVAGGSGTWQPFLSLTVPNATRIKSCLSGKSFDMAYTANGITPVLNTSITMPTSINRADFQAYSIHGTISRLTYWPKRLTNAQLQALTR